MSDKPLWEIDALLQDTWLQTISLRHGPSFHDGEGRVLWERCVEDVERVQERLKAAGMSDDNCRHILYAQCALLDEAVMGRGVEDDAFIQWYDTSLQEHFAGTGDVGNKLCNRMREVLHEPAPDIAVLICFHRVIMLGFLGVYRSLNDPQRKKLVDALNVLVPPFTYPQTHPVLADVPAGRGARGILFSWPACVLFSVLLLVALWYGLDLWLDRTLSALLSGVKK
jgi:type VI secretion system protein ImpK